MIAGSGNDRHNAFPISTNPDYEAAVWDTQSGTIMAQRIAWDMFCNGASTMPDGRVLIQGGTSVYGTEIAGNADTPFDGLANSAIFDPTTEMFSAAESTAHGRWYPTLTELGDGRIMTTSGLDENGNVNNTSEIYSAGWGPEIPGNPSGFDPSFVFNFSLYPRMHLLPTGQVFLSAPLPETLILGGDNPATKTTEIIDLGQPSPVWVSGPPMAVPRVEMEATLLPDGTVLVSGGSGVDEDAGTASLQAEIYDPRTNSFSSARSNVFPRLYHNIQLLLPDGTVFLAGSNPAQGSYENHIEIYKPAYLFNADNSPAVRPTITSVPLGVTYGGTFTVATPNTDIASVVLIKPGSVTHSFDMDQRLVGLSFTAVTGGLTATVPSNSNLTPPGYYMLFVVNKAGVPSVASFVHISGALAPVAAMAFRPLKTAPLHPAHMLHVTESPLPWRGKMH